MSVQYLNKLFFLLAGYDPEQRSVSDRHTMFFVTNPLVSPQKQRADEVVGY
jgi:hypothetical protein